MRQPAKVPSNPLRAPAPRPNAAGGDRTHRAAVLIDGSALFLASRGLYEGYQLDYRALVKLLVGQVGGLESPSDGQAHTRWVMWTSASPQNQGQTRFLEFAESELRWEVRRFSPIDSYIVEPSTALGLSTDSRAASRLVRFDASIAFAIGRLAHDHRIIVISDSFALADPLLRSAQIDAGNHRPSHIAFFGRALDPRWPRVLKGDADRSPLLIDLDDHADQLFGPQALPTDRSTKGGETLVF